MRYHGGAGTAKSGERQTQSRCCRDSVTDRRRKGKNRIGAIARKSAPSPPLPSIASAMPRARAPVSSLWQRPPGLAGVSPFRRLRRADEAASWCYHTVSCKASGFMPYLVLPRGVSQPSTLRENQANALSFFLSLHKHRPLPHACAATPLAHLPPHDRVGRGQGQTRPPPPPGFAREVSTSNLGGFFSL
jgi:hypothetical protein